jgi:ATP-binding cassette, subfamily B, bacterial
MQAFVALTAAFWKYSEGRRHLVVLYVLSFVMSHVLHMLEPYAVGQILNGIQHAISGQEGLMQLWWYLGMLLLLSVGFWLFHGPARLVERRNAFFVRRAFKQYLFTIVTSLPMQWHKVNHSGQTINRISKASQALFSFSENSFQAIGMVISPLGALIALALVMPSAAFVAGGVIVCFLSVVVLFDRVLLPLYGQVNERDHYVASALHDYITNIKTVVTLRLEPLTHTELWKRMTHPFPVYWKEVYLNQAKWFSTGFLISLMTSVVLGWYAWSTINAGGTLLVGTFFMLYDYLQKVGNACQTFAWKYGDTVMQYADFQSVEPILSADRAEYHAAHRLPDEWKTVEINHLKFAYEDEEGGRTHLKNVSIVLNRSRKIAFIGESGSGKSTLMALIRGLHPCKADVVCDGVPLPHGMKHLAAHVTLIPQDPEIFENTVEYNITLDTDQDQREVMEDVRLARFGSVLNVLPRGLKTHTAEKGVNFSGGEKQRLALARGFFAAEKSSILLLDEPTSSVDPGNERAIYENLFERFSDRCVVSSLHKLYLLPMFDEAYVFREGAVVAHGTPRELTSPGGALHELWERERSIAAKPI